MRTRRRARRTARAIGGVIPAGFAQSVVSAGAGFLGANLALNQLAQRVDFVRNASPWMQVGIKVAAAVGVAYFGRRLRISPTITNGIAIGGGVSALVDSYVILTQQGQRGPIGELPASADSQYFRDSSVTAAALNLTA